MMAVWRAFRRLVRAWGAAVRFLTVVPWGRWEATQPEDLGCAAALFPWVGGLLGLAVVAAHAAVVALGTAPPLAAAVALAVWVALTGGLHLDGLMDAADGLLGGRTPEHRLEIMRDERVGAFGVLAAVLVLLLKFAALQSAPVAAWVAAAVTGRWALVVLMVAFPYARPRGLGRMWHARVGWRAAVAASASAGWLLWALNWPRGWLAWAAAAAAVVLGARWALRRLPGLTGDVYGALAEIAEVAVLLTAALKGG